MLEKRVRFNKSLVRARGDHACGLIKTTECSQIEMIKVRMRQKD